jgi:hypothetical protein
MAYATHSFACKLHASSTAPSCCRRTRCAIPSPHRAARRAKLRVPDQAATSSPAPSRVPRARPHKHTTAGHQCAAAVELQAALTPARQRCCRSRLVNAAARRVASNSKVATTQLFRQGHTGRTAIAGARAPRVHPSDRPNRLPAAIKRPPRSPLHHAHSPLPRKATTGAAQLPPLFLRRERSPSSGRRPCSVPVPVHLSTISVFSTSFLRSTTENPEINTGKGASTKI